MADEPTKQRPWGEVLAQLYRPPQRFGWALTLGVRNEHDGKVWIARPGEDGDLVWSPIDPRVESPPTLFLDNEEIEKLKEILGSSYPEPKPHENASARHLDDAVTVRDRLLAMLEQEWSVRTDTGTRAT